MITDGSFLAGFAHLGENSCKRALFSMYLNLIFILYIYMNLISFNSLSISLMGSCTYSYKHYVPRVTFRFNDDSL